MEKKHRELIGVCVMSKTESVGPGRRGRASPAQPLGKMTDCLA